ncbi:MAG: cytochrome c family protein [Proteobacteria bacterium]|nr:cytochrome c family protein [Pseudomonadota bacterium]MBU1610603.1 cytochrome c family protein [Pseudomonadota bacterium]
MNTKAKITLLAAALLLLAALPAVSQEDVLTIGGESYGFVVYQRAPVTFAHSTHMDLEMVDGACTPCHHSGKDEMGKFVEGDTVPCKDCHVEEGDEAMPSMLTAYHGLCQNCHLEAAKGPVTCGECHIQKDFFGIPFASGE